MVQKITPSRQKFRIAKRAVAKLRGIFGESPKAAFVAGSVAANMAVPKSDLDLIFVFERHVNERKNFAKTTELINELEGKLGFGIDIFGISRKVFEDNARGILSSANRRVSGFQLEKLSHGAIPVFGDKKYLQEFGKSFAKPSRNEIIKRYKNHELEKIAQRVQFKRSIAGRKRFLPR